MNTSDLQQQIAIIRANEYPPRIDIDGRAYVSEAEYNSAMTKLSNTEYSLTAAESRIAEFERHNEMLRAVADDHKILLEQVMNWRTGIIGLAGCVYSGKLSKKRIDEMYDAVTAIDAGALDGEQ